MQVICIGRDACINPCKKEGKLYLQNSYAQKKIKVVVVNYVHNREIYIHHITLEYLNDYPELLLPLMVFSIKNGEGDERIFLCWGRSRKCITPNTYNLQG